MSRHDQSGYSGHETPDATDSGYAAGRLSSTQAAVYGAGTARERSRFTNYNYTGPSNSLLLIHVGAL